MWEKCKIGGHGALKDFWEGVKFSPKKPPSWSPMGNFEVRFFPNRTGSGPLRCEQVEGAKEVVEGGGNWGQIFAKFCHSILKKSKTAILIKLSEIVGHPIAYSKSQKFWGVTRVREEL